MNQNINAFVKRIILPTVLTILLFVITFFTYFIPRFEDAILEKKRETTKELTHNAISILERYHLQERQGKLTKTQAQKQAISIIKSLRYGPENKDYFWITDKTPIMIMHPYRSDLDGTDVSSFKDRANQHPFKLFVQATQQDGAGYVNYMWQWKDNPRKVVPKLSYVKLFSPWNWIIGTGIYIEDVKEEIGEVSSRIITISVIIVLMISLILLYLIKQTHRIEDNRVKAEEALAQSREKYRSIVEAGREGVSMIKGEQFIYYNHITSNILEYDDNEMKKIRFFDIFVHRDEAKKEIREGIKENPYNFEYQAKILIRGERVIKLTLQISQITYTQQPAFVVLFKDSFSALTKLEHHASSDLMVTIKSLNKKLKSIQRSPLIVDMNTPIEEAILLMDSHKENAILVRAKDKIVGVVTDQSYKKYISSPKKSAIYKLMQSPITTLNQDSSIFDAISLIKESSLSHIVVIDHEGEITGLVDLSDIVKNIELTYNIILSRIKRSNNIYELKSIFADVHQLIYTLINSGTNSKQLTQTLGKISDQIMKKVIDFAHQKLGPAPCPYAFVVLGSVARMEQTLFTDQDNAIILPDKYKDDGFFESLTTFVTDSLATIGYNKCPGELMASNPKWRVSLSEWKRYFTDWISNSQQNDLTATSIFLDMRLIYGNQILLNELTQTQQSSIKNAPTFTRNLAHKVTSLKLPVNLIGNIADIFDVKSLCRIIVDIARLYALKEGLTAPGTFERMDQLYNIEAFNKKTYDSIVNTLDLLTKIRLRHQCQLILDGLPPDNVIHLNKLSEFEQTTLKRILGEIQSYQTMVGNQFS